MRVPRFSILQLLLAAALIALVLGLFTSAWRVSSFQQIQQVAFSPSGKLLAARFFSGAVQVWRLDGGRPRLVAQAFDGQSPWGFAIGTIHFVTDDRLLKQHTIFSGGAISLQIDELIVSTRQTREVKRFSPMQPESCVAGNDWLYSIDPTNAATIVGQNLREQRPLRRWSLPSAASQPRLAADGHTLAITDQKGLIYIIDVEGESEAVRVAGGGPLQALSADGRLLAVAHPGAGPGGMTQVGIYATREPSLPEDINTGVMLVTNIELSADGSRLLVQGDDLVELYDVQSRQRLAQIPLDSQANIAAGFLPGFMAGFSEPQAALSPDGQLLATFSSSQVRLRELPSGKVIHELTAGSRTLQITIFTLGFALWSAAWGIVAKRERARQPQSQRVETNASRPLRPVPKVQSPLWKLGGALVWVSVLLLGVIVFSLIGQPLSWGTVWSVGQQLLLGLAGVAALAMTALWLIRLVMGPHHLTLVRLRQITGTTGRLTRRGQAQFWFATSSPLEAEIGRVLDEVAERGESVFGYDDIKRRQTATLVAWLDRQCDLDAFVGRHMPIAAIVPDVWRGTNAIVCEETALRNFGRPKAALRAALALMFAIRHKRGLLPGWVAGLASREICTDEETPADVRAAVRRLRVLLARQPHWNPQVVFRRTATERRALWLGLEDPAAWREVHAEMDLLATLAPLLLGDDSPASRRERTLAWLRTIQRRDDPVTTLAAALGCSLDELLAEWLAKIEGAGDLLYDVPSAERQAQLRSLIASQILDRTRPAPERARAVRNLGGTSFVGAAGPIIELLAQPRCEFRLELIECLENLSGQRFGDDLAAWQAWWPSLPAAVRWEAAQAPVTAEIVRQQPPVVTRRSLPHLKPPLELKLVWGLMTIGGLAALAIPITFLFLVGPILFLTIYFSLFVGVQAIARGAARETYGLPAAVNLQVINIIACDPINLLLAGLEHALLRRPNVRQYLEEVSEREALTAR